MVDNDIKKESQDSNIFKISDLYTVFFDKKLGGGAFGKIYSCMNNKTKELYACKVEKLNIANPQLNNEYRILSLLKNFPFFPKCYQYYSSIQGNFLILDLLGPNLEVIMSNLPNKRYSMKSTLLIMTQCLERLKEIHDKGIIHRDMKPENLVIGNKGKEKNIYLIDFGLSKIIASDKKSNILFIKKEKIVVGTLRYISINAHLGNEQYKKDDLESLAYIMIYFIKGELPWQNMKSKTRKEKYSKIYQMKKKMVPNELCNFLPEEMKTFLNYIVSLNAKAKPDYAKLINLINNLMKKYSYCNDLQFDWCSPLFLKMIYNKPAVDDGEKKKSSSIYEEDSSNSGNNIKKIKTNRYATSSSKKNKLNNNFNNKIKTLKAIKITSVKNIKDFYRQNAFSPGNIKTSLNIDTNKNEKVKNDYKKLAISMNNYLNNDSFNRERLSSY